MALGAGSRWIKNDEPRDLLLNESTFCFEQNNHCILLESSSTISLTLFAITMLCNFQPFLLIYSHIMIHQSHHVNVNHTLTPNPTPILLSPSHNPFFLPKSSNLNLLRLPPTLPPINLPNHLLIPHFPFPIQSLPHDPTPVHNSSPLHKSSP